MSNRDPIFVHSTELNPTAISYTPLSFNSMPSQVSPPPSPYLESRIVNLEESLGELKDWYHELSSSLAGMKKDMGWRPLQAQNNSPTSLRALEFSQELEELTREVHKSVDGVVDVEKISGTTIPKAHVSVPPHLRGASNGAVSKIVPPHLRGKVASGVQERGAVTTPNSRLVTDGPVDGVTMGKVSATVPSPPSSPVTIVEQGLDVDNLSLNTWKPFYLTTLKPFEGSEKIPRADKVTTFHPQFLEEVLGGSDWSPGLKFVVGNSTCIIRNRTYYQFDAATEPYLPEAPGQHGAKLTAFFNKAPEEEHDLPEDVSSSEDVPMFVRQTDGRYAYFGNYTQSRWSDKLDYDSMMARVPQSIKEHWATELTSAVRPPWVTEELKKHFFQKPDYSGRIYSATEPDAPTATTEEEIKDTERMVRDVRKYVEELREWERDANMMTALIKKQFILDAFDAADADNPPALRLWWEYLECVKWHGEFYELLVTLQSREARYSK